MYLWLAIGDTDAYRIVLARLPTMIPPLYARSVEVLETKGAITTR
jgi:hypothetical protein